MRLLTTISIILAMGSPVLADDWTTSDGILHKNVKIVVAGKDTVTIKDDSGQETIRYADLPPEAQRQFGMTVTPATQVKIVTRAPIEQIGTDGTVTSVTMAEPDTLYALVRYVPVGLNGTPQVILADPQGRPYRIDLRATDYSPPPAVAATHIISAPPSAVTPSPNTPANTPPQPLTPALISSSNAVAASDNIVRIPDTCSYHAPTGWRIRSGAGSTTACDMRGENDCVAMIDTAIIPKDVSLRKFAQDWIDLDKRIHSVQSDHEDVQQGDLQPFTTTSGWEGLKCVETVRANGADLSQTMFYFFEGHDETKIVVSATCHSGAVGHYTSIFEDVVMTFVRE